MLDKNFLNSSEYDFLRNDPHLGDNIILMSLSGSYAYGTNGPTSDIDVRGIALRRKEDLALNEDFETFAEPITDTQIWSFDKYLEEISKNNPSCLEILGVRDEDYLKMTDLGKLFIDNSHRFLSKKCIDSYTKFAAQQLYRLRQKLIVTLSQEEYQEHLKTVIAGMNDQLIRGYGISNDMYEIYFDMENEAHIKFIKPIDAVLNDVQKFTKEILNMLSQYKKNNAKRKENIYIKDVNKHAHHSVRLYMMVNDILLKEQIITYRKDEHDLLMDIKNGKFMLKDGSLNDEFWKIVDEYQAKFEEAKKLTKLPEQVDINFIRDLKLKVNTSIMNK